MHYLVRVIVTADDAKEANFEANRIMEELVSWHDFDWYTTVSGESRWPDCWKPYRLSSKEAQTTVASAMSEQREVFDQSINTIRVMLNVHTDDEIFNEQFTKIDKFHMSRHQFTKVGGYHGNTSRLFDNYGDVILNQRELDMYLSEPDGLWVVQVDAHN